jgi:hypothetical protein
VRCTAIWYSRLCEVHFCLFIGSCRWNPVLLCVTAVWVKCHFCLFIGSCRWNPRFDSLDKPAFHSTVKSNQHSFSQIFLLAGPFLFSKNNHGSSHPSSRKYNFRMKWIQI